MSDPTGPEPLPAPSEPVIAAEILRLLGERERDASICPSEVARSLGRAQSWRSLMQAVRQVAGRMAGQGRVRITQGGKDVDLDSVTGPIRIRRT